MGRVWAGIDIGKEHHHCVVIDADGKRLLSRRASNNENELSTLLADVAVLGSDVIWAVDVVDGGAALGLAILLAHGLWGSRTRRWCLTSGFKLPSRTR